MRLNTTMHGSKLRSIIANVATKKVGSWQPRHYKYIEDGS